MKVDALMEGNAHQRTENSRSMRQPFNMYSLEAYQFLVGIKYCRKNFFSDYSVRIIGVWHTYLTLVSVVEA